MEHLKQMLIEIGADSATITEITQYVKDMLVDESQEGDDEGLKEGYSDGFENGYHLGQQNYKQF